MFIIFIIFLLSSSFSLDKSVDEKYAICKTQLDWWKRELLILEEKRSSDNSKTQSTRSTVYVMPEGEAPTLTHSGSQQTTTEV